MVTGTYNFPGTYTLLCASISDLTSQLHATLWSQNQPILLTSGTLAIGK
ncbi:hypothetical protein H6B69_22280, partial [Pseudoflavonifractor phocaeensis]|nr:hypothetical protein [Pseudoflavonifractor phocaeensis]